MPSLGNLGSGLPDKQTRSRTIGRCYVSRVQSWSVYMLRCRDGTLYTGITVDLRRRLEAHGSGAAAKYTRSRRPVTLVYQESQPDRSRAQKREAALRALGRAGKLILIAARRGRGD